MGWTLVGLTQSPELFCPNGDVDEVLRKFGEELIREMNRVGILVDLSHVSDDTALQALSVKCGPERSDGADNNLVAH